MAQDFETLSQRVLEYARDAGADGADVLLVNGTTLSIEVREGALEHAERSEGIDIGLRVFKGQRQANVSVADASDSSLRRMAERAVAMAQLAPEDPFCGLADPEQLAQDWDAEALELHDTAAAPKPAELQEQATIAEQAALSVKGVDQVSGAGAGYSSTQVHLATSNGFTGGYGRSSTSLSCVAISGQGLQMERDWAGEARSHADELPTAQEIGQLAGTRAVARFGATRPPTGTYPVLFDERISSSLIGHLIAAINGSSIVRGSSWLKDAMGEQVLPDGMDLIEDPTRKRVAGSRPFDGEGLPVAPRHLVQDGVLKSWTLDLATARQLGLQSTANASRSVSSPPSPTTGNLALTQGSLTHEDLIAQMGTGLIVTSLIGSTINANTGDYSRGASGLWVENGQIVGPVNECTIASNLRQMMRTIIPANDARGHLSRVIPSLLVENMVIAGG